MQAESCIRRQPPKRTAAGVQRADEDVIAHEQKQADEVTNLVSDEDMVPTRKTNSIYAMKA